MVGGGLVAADHGVPDVRFCIIAPPCIDPYLFKTHKT
jgi:hypothetical protein